MAHISKIAQLITDDIVGGRLAFGARLTIDDLSSRYNVSHMPIREALRELSGAGLLEIGSGRSAWVRRVDIDFVHNLFETRSALEVLVMKRAAQNATPSTLAPVRVHQAQLEAAAEAQDPAGVLRANEGFHSAINILARNSQAVELIDRQWILVKALWARVGYAPERHAGVISDHRHILTALAEGDPEAAGVLMGAHVLKARYELLSRLRALDIPELRAA